MSRPSSGIASPPLTRMTSRSRTQSISSDRPSTIGHSFMSPPLSVSPEAAFIASSAASQIVTNDHDSHADAWYDEHGVEPSGETAMISPAALQLVNNFLDQLLFNFLSISRSTTLSSLRPAVSEVLKPKLAKDAINQADEELREYLGGGEDEDILQPREPTSPGDWDLELVWKRTRLRCMVYSSLGDMEEEDEDYYMEQEHLDPTHEDPASDVVSPAVAIFLTSILEFMGEQALVVAGQAAYHRMHARYEKELKEGSRSPVEVADRILIEELDMERVALDRTLGRLWRAWKKKIRSPVISIGMEQALSRRFSRDSLRGIHLRSPSTSAEAAVPATVPEPAAELDDHKEQPPLEEASIEPIAELDIAAGIPLPTRPNDIDEIEVPGLISYSDDEEEDDQDDVEPAPARPKSLMILPSVLFGQLPTPTGSQPPTPTLMPRKRANSLPTPSFSPYRSPPETPEILPVSPGQDDPELLGNSTIGKAAAEPISVNPDRDSSQARVEAERSGEQTEQSQLLDAASEPTVSSTSGLAAIAETAATEGDNNLSEDDGEEVDDAEEPQILTSSRISISGRSSSPAASDHGKPLTINVNLPARPPSIHSLRLIEVSSPRSPVTRSRRSSVDTTDHVRTGSISRTGSVRTPPIPEEDRFSDRPSARRVSTGLLQGRSAAPANGSISEAEEATGKTLNISSLVSEDDQETGPVSRSEPAHPVGAVELGSQPIFGSARRRTASPASPVKPPTATKVTILPHSVATGTFFIQDEPESADTDKVALRARSNVPSAISVSNPMPPVVPERSPGRQSVASLPSAAAPATIGIVSVDRTRPRSPHESAVPRPQDQPPPAGTRHTHASGSSITSSIRLKAVRTSEESANTHADVARNFEELIHSDQTIQYTLTPESMRDMDNQSSRSMATGSPIVPVKSRKSEDARYPGDRSRSSSLNNRGQSDLKRSTSVSQSTGLHSHPVADVSGGGGSVPRSPSGVLPKIRPNAPQARDARMPRESLADLAEFIRSTGPSGAAVSSPSGASPASRSSEAGAMRAASGPVAVTNGTDSSRMSLSSQAARSRLQAREAAVDYKDDNSDLIDFIRRGPPAASGNPRIPRNVAPFRTTMDSDQLSGAVGGRAVDAQIRDIDVRSSQASTNVTESSFNSQSALLGRGKQMPAGGSRFGGVDENEMPMPKRKTRRARDPYSLDLSDDEMDAVEAAPAANRRAPPREESLADFLKNYAPPPEPVSKPMQNKPKKKASAPSLMARFGRRDSSNLSPTGSNGSMSPKSPPKVIPDSRSLNSRAGGGRGYIPIQVNMPPGVDTYGLAGGYGSAGAGIGAGTSNSGMPSTSGRRVPMKRFEPRDAVSVPSRGTSDLAAFLKNSEPPPGMSPSPQYAPSMGSPEATSFSRVFVRRKKSSAA